MIPLLERHWHEFTVEHPEMLPRSRYVQEADREEPTLHVDPIAFLHFVRWAQQKGYGPAGVSGLIPWGTGDLSALVVCPPHAALQSGSPAH